MADARLRELERRAETGDVDAHRRLLLERERAGQVTREQLALAAHAGLEPARRALDAPPPSRDLLAWARGFYAFGQEACVRVVAAAAAALLALDHRVDEGQATLDALRPWLECPCPAHAEAPVALARERWGSFVHAAGLLLACEWVQGERPGPAVVLRRDLTWEAAEAARAELERTRAGAADLVAQGAAWGLRLRECFPLADAVSSTAVVVALRRVSVPAPASFAAIHGVNAVSAVLHHAKGKRDRAAVRAAVCEALIAPGPAALSRRCPTKYTHGMSDARLRDLERQAATGDLSAGARLLLERERLGHLTRAQLELAAHVGEPAAARALGAAPLTDAATWARGFYRFGRDVCVRVTAAATATLLERGPALLRRGGPAQLAPLEALHPWLACPCDTHAAPAIALARRRAFELPSLPGIVLALDWPDDAPGFVLRGGLTRAEADRARAMIDASHGAADVAPDASGVTWCVRLRERFPVVQKVALVRDVRAISGAGLAESLGAVEGVNAVVRVIHDAAQALGLEAVRAAVGEAVVASAARTSDSATRLT